MPTAQPKFFLTFTEIPNEPSVLKRWRVYSALGTNYLGGVGWHTPWRRYVFYPHTNTLFDAAACLREIAEFCQQRTDEQKVSQAARRAERKTEAQLA